MEKEQIREVIARRAARELHDGDVVNLGIGLPTMIPNFLPEGITVTLQTENGAIYNLAGQRVDASYRGVVIMNGKKFIQK